ncbi:MAG: DUF420 domain-containing protein [Rhodospirillales bacterium]|nr:DUF420 domain-containing protein [Rhodospirillales bacterium]
MTAIAILPHVNAVLNAAAACFLMAGFIFIRSGHRDAHRAAMLGAASISGLFLISYVTLRFYAPIFVFQGLGAVRIFYYIVLVSHVALAMAIVPLVAMTLVRALTGRFDAHKRIARWAWPVWMYVSLSGIFVYLMLYQIYPADMAALG